MTLYVMALYLFVRYLDSYMYPTRDVALLSSSFVLRSKSLIFSSIYLVLTGL